MSLNYDLLDCIGIDSLCEMIEQGDDLRKIAESVGVSYSAIWRYLHSTPERANRYALAMEYSAEALLEKGRSIIESSLSKKGDVDPQAARALAQEYARLAGIRNKAYSDKPQVAVQINNNAQPLALPDKADAVAASRAYQALIEGKTPSK